MNPEIKREWIAALRSDQYVQGQGRLKRAYFSRASTFCCLGVLCDLAEKAGIIKSNDDGAFITGYDEDSGEPWTEEDYVPEVVVHWAGLNSNNPEVLIMEENEVVGEYAEDVTLSYLNDDRGYDFLQIAAAIERSL